MPAKSNTVLIVKRMSALKTKAAERLQILPEKCHVGHVVFQAMSDNSGCGNQLDAVTDISETNGSVLSRSTRLASAMRNYGLKVGDVVAIMGPNHLGLAIPYYACHFNGQTLCCIDGNITDADQEYLYNTIKPKMVFCLQSQAAQVQGALMRSRQSALVVCFDGEKTDMESFIKENKGTEANFRPAELDAESTSAWLMLTSGTTGRPKCAMVSYAGVYNAVECWWYQFTNQIERTLVIGTIQWMSAMLFYISGPVMGFTRIQSSIPMTPQWLVAIINKYKPHATVWTPHLLAKFLHAVFNVCDLSSFKYIAIGGSSVEKPLVDKFRQKCNAYLYLVYGMTELMVPIFDYNKNVPYGSSGKPYEKFKYKLITDQGTEAKVGENGELLVKGDGFFKGYLNNPEETDAIVTKDGWMKTGDIFYRDEEDYYYYVERKRLLIKHTGQWISPIQLEDVIKMHPGVSHVCVVGIPDTLDVEIPVAAIVKKDQTSVDPEEIFTLMKKELPPLKQLHGGLFFIDTLPVTPSGKIHRAKTREIAFATERIMPMKK